MVVNASVEAENKIGTIKVAVKLVSRSRHPRKFMGMLGGNPSIKMVGFKSSFQYVENKYMEVRTLD